MKYFTFRFTYFTCTILYCYSNVIVSGGIETAIWSGSKSQNERRNTSTSSSWEGNGTQKKTERRNKMRSWNYSESDGDETWRGIGRECQG